MIARVTVAAFCCLVILGCQDRDDGTVEASGGEADRVVWTLAADPQFTASGVMLDGDSIHFFGISAAAFGPSGDVAVGLTGGTENRVIFVDSSGRGVRSVGRTGPGPGEFRHVTSIYPGETYVTVWDGRNRRLSFIRERGDSVRELSPDMETRRRFVGVFDDGSFVLDHIKETEGSSVGGDTHVYEIWETSGGDRRVLAEFRAPAKRTITLQAFHDGGAFRSNTNISRECWPYLYAGISGRRLIVANGGGGPLWSVAPSGERRVFLEEARRPRLTDEMVAEVRQWFEFMEERFQQPMPGPEGLHAPTNAHFSPGAVDSVLGLLGEVGGPAPSAWSAMRTEPNGRILA